MNALTKGNVGRSERSDLRHGNPMKAYVSEVAPLAPTYISHLLQSHV